MSTEESAKKKALSDEIDRIEESAKDSAQSQLEQAKFWRGLNLVFGAPAAILAAVSSATGLSNAANRVIAAYLALAAAGLGALVTTLNTNRRVTQAHSTGNAYLEVQTAARQLRLIDLHELPYEDVRNRLQELTARRDEINKTADIPSFYAYWRGQQNIGKDRQKYAVDEQGKSNNG